MKKQDKQFIKDWYFSDFDIQIQVGRKKNNVLTLENNASYYNGIRFKGKERSLDAIMDFDKKDYERIKDLLGYELSYDEMIERLEDIENKGFKLKLL
jgi:hypothetical protein